MTLSEKDVVARSDDFETRAAAYELRAWQWAFLHEIDGVKEVRDVAYAGGVDMDLATDFIAESEAAGLVRVISMTLHEYRNATGIAAPEQMPAEDSLGGYESAVPAWMIEHHEHRETPEPVAEYSPEPVAEYSPEPVAEYAPEPVADYAESTYAWQPDTHAAEPEAQPVAEYPEPMHEWQPDAYVAEPAEHDEEPAVAHEATAQWQPDAYVAEQHAAPVAFEIGGAEETDAGHTVANLMSLEHHGAEPAEPSTNGHAVSMSFGDELQIPMPEAQAPTPSWEPMSLVTTVDEAAPAMHEEPSYDYSAGVPVDEAHAELPSPEEKGSIAFSFTPDMMAPVDVAPVERQRSAPLPEMPNAPMSPPPQQQRQMSGPPVQNGKGDLVGNLIARAFTFRIK